jgi:ketosteroid isomerase-like protein
MVVFDIHSNKRLAADFCRLYSNGDWGGLAGVLAEDFRWRQPTSGRRQSGLLADAPTLNADPGWSKRETLLVFEQTVARCVDNHFVLKPVSMTAEDDRVSVEAVGHAVNAVNQRVYDNRYHHLFVCRDGLIAELREYQDTLALYDVWMAP